MSSIASSLYAPGSRTSSRGSQSSRTLDPDLLIDRNIRQRDILPADRIERIHAIVIGLGAIGRPLCEQLAILGVRKFTLFDHDTIEIQNLGVQGYREKDLRGDKAKVCARDIKELHSLAEVDAHCHRFAPKNAVEVLLNPACDNVVFCCVDSIAAREDNDGRLTHGRAEIWPAMKNRCKLWIDTRMNTETVRVLASDIPSIDEYYDLQLFSTAEAQSGACTAQSMVFPACQAVVMAMSIVADWIRDRPVTHDQIINLAAKEWVILQE